MNSEITVGLVGIGGYGSGFADQLLHHSEGKGVRWVAAADPYPQHASKFAAIQEKGIPVYTSLEDLYGEHCPDLMVISSPIHCHCEQTCMALAKGSSVLCEKPVAATIQEALAMEQASAAAGCFAAIGYQWSFSPPMQALKQDILAGRLGRPLKLKTLVSWPRKASYYGRNAWAGALKDPEGHWVLDSPVSNATAHYLHNMLYVLGATRESSASPAWMEAELYRANPISNFDTGFLRCRTTDEVDILYYATHAVSSHIGPVIRYEFEQGVVTLTIGADERLTVRFRDGTQKVYGDPSEDPLHKLWYCADALRGGESVPCTVRSAIPHLLCVNGAWESKPGIVDFPEAMRHDDAVQDDDRLIWVQGLQAVMVQCYDQGLLPHEHGGFDWSQAGARVDLSNYRHFPAG